MRFTVLVLIAGIALTTVAHSASPEGVESAVSDPTRNITVYTIDATGPGQLTAVSAGGAVLYRNTTYQIYHDVDPVEAGSHTVLYVASELLDSDACSGSRKCIRNVVETVNLTTGNVTTLYSTVGPRIGSSQIHDVDRVNESVLLVGDIGPPDRVYMVNTTTGEIVWEWRVENAYEPESGGSYPGDWTHLNDVEMLADGRIMVSLRNMDQVVFVRPGKGLLEKWTLGCDDCHEILYEQHNPDYIPEARGGPAIIIADSENNRLVEYQRSGNEWNRSWVWTDFGLQWPRDVDRLPNGNTLIADSHGNRILEVNRSGAIVWQYVVPDGVYDVERLGTGDESTDGQSADRLGYENHHGDKPTLVTLVPNILLHGLLWTLPMSITPLEAAALTLASLVLVLWLIGEVGFAVHNRQT